MSSVGIWRCVCSSGVCEYSPWQCVVLRVTSLWFPWPLEAYAPPHLSCTAAPSPLWPRVRGLRLSEQMQSRGVSHPALGSWRAGLWGWTQVDHMPRKDPAAQMIICLFAPNIKPVFNSRLQEQGGALRRQDPKTQECCESGVCFNVERCCVWLKIVGLIFLLFTSQNLSRVCHFSLSL